ncbi:MAG: energy transducer TonB [Bacteroidales bacterium]|nr:energy transducer TonB [Bacteroidales bacterium]
MKRLILAILALSAGFSAMAQGVRKTAEEFNRMSRRDTSLVVLHGVVSRPRANDTRGVFYLEDETGEAYIYGLVDGRPGSNQSFAQMGIVPGDTLTVSGRRTVYNGRTIEMAGGHLLRKADGPDHAAMAERMKAPDQWPTFKGKDANAFSSWVTARLKYPKDAKAAHIDGIVHLRFVVGTNGGIQEVEVVKGVFPSLDAEAVRVVKSSPKWKPAIKDGRPVRMAYDFPVIFEIPE